jgi:ankyrin repeat protein
MNGNTALHCAVLNGHTDIDLSTLSRTVNVV